MSPQFVDFDADGHLDIVAGTFDGSPHLARGSSKGFAQPEPILDADGVRIAIHDFWNFDTSKWENTSRGDAPGEPPAKGHATSAIAVDDDGDGDLDLLLGDHKTGHVYRRENRGTAARPAFARENRRVLAGGAPIDVPGTVATLRLVDWDHDGRVDLLVGSMGDAYAEGPGGGVFWFRNGGDGKATRYEAPVTLIAPSQKDATEATRPDSGLYMDAGDVDGDGDLDLVVGGYSHWRAKAPILDDAQQRRLAAIRSELQALDTALGELNRLAQEAGKGLPEAEAGKRYTEFYKGQKAERDANRAARMPLQTELDALVPSMQRRSFTWLYENTTKRR